MGLSPVYALLGFTIVLLVGIFVVGRIRLDRNVDATVDELLVAAAPPSEQPVRTSDLAALPAPIRRYLGHVLRDGQPYVRTARLQQRGTFRSGGASSSWSPFTATQHVTTRPPGFVWDASIRIFPGISVRALDVYCEGHGDLWARLASVVPVASSTPSPELDEGELMRYLAEAPLYPTALLPAMGIQWAPIDDRSARATVEHRGTTASLVFYVNDQNEVDQVTGRRAFSKEDGTYERRPWKGYWRNYQPRNGMRVPIDGEVAWLRPEGEVSYWRGHMEHIDYDTAVRTDSKGRSASSPSNRDREGSRASVFPCAASVPPPSRPSPLDPASIAGIDRPSDAPHP